MSLLSQLLVIFTLCLVGEGIALILPFAFPASIISMILLLVLLCFKWIHLEHIQAVSEFLLHNMAFFFIPAGVAIIEKYPLLRGNELSLLIICLITTVLTFLTTTYTVSMIIRIMGKGNKHE
ncbi:antiholin-like protein LrgA [Lachnospiraceae bacterium KM106-2]|nr:antiholin-like protein LrgA [Lachnospiraceae bacterium KM106-2]